MDHQASGRAEKIPQALQQSAAVLRKRHHAVPSICQHLDRPVHHPLPTARQNPRQPAARQVFDQRLGIKGAINRAFEHLKDDLAFVTWLEQGLESCGDRRPGPNACGQVGRQVGFPVPGGPLYTVHLKLQGSAGR